MNTGDTPYANPLAGGPLDSRADLQRAVRDLYDPLRPFTTSSGAQVHLASFAAVFEQRVAGLEGFARPLFGIVPLAVGGGQFEHWDRIAEGLRSGTNPTSPEYWGPVVANVDQRMVEMAAIGLALAFCPERVWEPLSPADQDHLVNWLRGIYEFEPAANNWQFFRVLVSLGLERVGADVDRAQTRASLDLLDTYRRGESWYVDGALGTVDYYVPFALHTYGLMYAAANDVGLGDDDRAESYRQRAAGFAEDFQHWFATDGASIAMGRSLTYRFAMSSFWGAMAWANVDSTVDWGLAKGITMRHLRWWSDKAVTDRDGVLSVGFAYDNRKLCEGYNSACSPYWAMKAFAGLAAPETHPYWTEAERQLEPLAEPITLDHARWVVTRNDEHAVALVSAASPPGPFPEESAAKYHKFAYSSAFGLSGDAPDTRGGSHTDSMLALTDSDGNRRVRAANVAGGVESGMAWSTWLPWPDVRVDTVCWAVDGTWHGRIHRIMSKRPLHSAESGFCVGYIPHGSALDPAAVAIEESSAAITTGFGSSAIVDRSEGSDRKPVARQQAVNVALMHPNTAVPILLAEHEPGGCDLACLVFGSPHATPMGPVPEVSADARALLDRIAGQPLPTTTADRTVRL